MVINYRINWSNRNHRLLIENCIKYVLNKNLLDRYFQFKSFLKRELEGNDYYEAKLYTIKYIRANILQLVHKIKMESLPSDMVNIIVSYLTRTETSILSISSKYLSQKIKCFSPLYYSIYDNQQVDLALSCGFAMDEFLYFHLGMTGNIQLFERFAIGDYYFFTLYTLSEKFSSFVYNGAAYTGNILLMKFIDKHFRAKSEDFHACAMSYAVVSKNYESINYLRVNYRRDIMCALPITAVRKLDIELLIYCKKNKIDYSFCLCRLVGGYIVDVDYKGKLTLGHLKKKLFQEFVDNCRANKIEFYS